MLTRCTTSYGGTSIIEGAPRMRYASDVLYVPQGCGSPYGMFDRDGALIAEGAFMRGIPQLGLVSQQPFTPLDPLKVSRVADTGLHLYIGQIHHHFGHFLISTLSRLWPLRNASWSGRGLKILFSNPGPSQGYLSPPFIRPLLAALGLGEADFVNFDLPTIIPNAIIPAPAFVENHCAYREFATFCNDLGARIGGPAAVADRPIYLTKEYVANGVTHLVNEAELTQILAAKGVAIVAPERLDLSQQIALFRDNTAITGLLGSAFHTSLFAAPGRYMMLNCAATVWSNQMLVDGCNSNESVYLSLGPDMAQDPGGNGWINNYRLVDPPRTADRLLQAMERFARGPWPARRDPAPAQLSADPRRRVTQPQGSVVSRGATAQQSSHSHWSLAPTSAEDAAGAVSGVLTGRYQFHTDEDDPAWWQLDLGSVHLVTGVIVYNREDVGGERANHCRVLLSEGGADWREVGRRVEDHPFGGKDGEPWSILLEQAVKARLVRVELLQRRHFHLDQVEVFALTAMDVDALLD